MDEIYALLIAAAVIIVIIIIFFALRVFRSRPIGSVCSANADCNSGLVCDTTLKVCRAPISAVCTSNADCTSNATCVSGVCQITQTTAPAATPTPTTITTPTTTAFTPILATYSDSCDEASNSDTSWSRTKRNV